LHFLDKPLHRKHNPIKMRPSAMRRLKQVPMDSVGLAAFPGGPEGGEP
jgi:hypothetical protein